MIPSITLLSPGVSKLMLTLVATLSLISITGCNDEESVSNAKLRVITTIYPVTYFADRIAGDNAEVRSIMSPGVEAHDFEPTPNDIIDLQEADILIYTAPSFESWVADALENVGENLIAVRTADLSEDERHDEDNGSEDEHGHGSVDPHVWLNPLEAIEQVRAIEEAFVSADADSAEDYRSNAAALIRELEQLDTEMATALSSCALDTIVVSHEAYGHLAERYELHQIGLADIGAEFESTPRRVSEIIDRMESLGVQHILQEPIVSDDLAVAVADETGAAILTLHPMESLTPAQTDAGDNYFIVMRRNLETLTTALGCE